jgi:uncharacterized cupin superfamily protein
MSNTPAARYGIVRPDDAEFKPLELANRDPSTGIRGEVWVAYQSEDRRRVFGMCRFTPGRTWFRAPDETLIVLSGRVRITIDGGEPLEPEVGEAVYFREGHEVCYEVLEAFEEWFWMARSEPFEL